MKKKRIYKKPLKDSSLVDPCTLLRRKYKENLSKGLNRNGINIQKYWAKDGDTFVGNTDTEWIFKSTFGIQVYVMPEPLRAVVYKEKTIPGYYVAESGNVYSSCRGAGMGKGYIVCEGEDIPKYLKKLKPSLSKNYPYVHLKLPENLFDYNYRRTGKGNSRQSLSVQVHQLVMHTWRPVLSHPPKKLQHCWNETPLESKKFIRDCLQINHIDHDSRNNNVDNLEWCTPMENARECVKHWNGNNANKKNILKSEGKLYIPSRQPAKLDFSKTPDIKERLDIT